jgi:hypothetical protein
VAEGLRERNVDSLRADCLGIQREERVVKSWGDEEKKERRENGDGILI